MKEVVNADYFVDIRHARLPEVVDAYLPNSYEFTLNQGLDVVVLPWLASSPWPEHIPFDEEDVKSREDAGWFAAGQWSVVVVPGSAGPAKIDHIARRDVDGLVNVIVWMPAEKHAQLQAELAARLDLPIDHPDGPRTRLSQLGRTALGEFLVDVIPGAVVSEGARRALCLPPREPEDC